MTNSNSRNTLSDSDIFLLLCLTPFAVPLVIALVPGWWGSSLTWLVERKILVAASESPLLTFPGQIGGLDLPRLVICGAVLIAASVCGFSAFRALHERRIDRRLASGDRL
ncbi:MULTISPECIES: hypothetical protein [Rhodococcus erythropolis group]|uniref:Uncharacterized protein n=1 Tax=Rhodococcus erythropolis TaxID=1833 RepID=Q6XN86_RHOER|nr:MULTISPECIES: hypothetical protein [Rhodococcus erythropolis group]AAP73945.1 hypothetical protein PBD2.060 [Rhodococcus erythropolis]QXC46654.1 hypothetical protein KSE96_32525 [Rhodococcus qingshengii]